MDVETKSVKRWTSGSEYSGAAFVSSKDHRAIAFRGASTSRYATGEEAEVEGMEDKVNGAPIGRPNGESATSPPPPKTWGVLARTGPPRAGAR